MQNYLCRKCKKSHSAEHKTIKSSQFTQYFLSGFFQCKQKQIQEQKLKLKKYLHDNFKNQLLQISQQIQKCSVQFQNLTNIDIQNLVNSKYQKGIKKYKQKKKQYDKKKQALNTNFSKSKQTLKKAVQILQQQQITYIIQFQNIKEYIKQKQKQIELYMHNLNKFIKQIENIIDHVKYYYTSQKNVYQTLYSYLGKQAIGKMGKNQVEGKLEKIKIENREIKTALKQKEKKIIQLQRQNLSYRKQLLRFQHNYITNNLINFMQDEIIAQTNIQQKQDKFQSKLNTINFQNLQNQKRLNLKSLNLINADFLDQNIKDKLVNKSLNQLNVSKNKLISGQILKIFLLSNIKILKINFTNLGDQGIKILTQMQTLIVLQAQSCGITNKHFNRFTNLAKLQSLNLASNNLTITNLQSITFNLVKLNISFNLITKQDIQIICHHFNNLQYLNLNNIKIGNKPCVYFDNCYKLKRLYLNHCKIYSKGAKYLAEGKYNLQQLHIARNHIQQQGILQVILHQKSLKHLNTNLNPLKHDSILRIHKIFQKLHPQSILHISKRQQ